MRCIIGRDYALQHLNCPIGLRIRRSDKVGNRIFIEGNAAAALAPSMAAPRCAPGIRSPPRPRWPRRLPEILQPLPRGQGNRHENFAIVQAEDEMASIGMVIGAAWNGARAFTATSGPGISLMQEFLGLAYFAEIPR
jgi:2-oxoglutarate ferredoxin oxidoreductase subunit alpha